MTASLKGQAGKRGSREKGVNGKRGSFWTGKGGHSGEKGVREKGVILVYETPALPRESCEVTQVRLNWLARLKIGEGMV